MCGIVGYTGFRKATTVLLDALKRLEYRGYDSAGIAVADKKLHVYKDVGEISQLAASVPDMPGHCAISHTRWATHGTVSKENAHPHMNNDNTIAVVHNGIIENFKQLREDLEADGYTFVSQTDTEVLAHLIDKYYTDSLEHAVVESLRRIQGSYAVIAVSTRDPGKIVGARKESPLVIGVGDNENFIASDIPAVLKYTKRVIFLEEEELCILTDKTIAIQKLDGTPVEREKTLIDWDIKDAEKAGFPHFMLKEIFEQPETVQQVLRGRVSEIDRQIYFPGRVEALLQADISTIHIIACGTSLYAGYVAKYYLEKLTKLPVVLELASEYRFFGVRDERSLVIGITQSGETMDTLMALREAKNAGCKTLVVCNVIGSTATRLADGYVLMQSGPEIGVAATKTFTSQIIVLFLLALKIAFNRTLIGSDEIYDAIVHMKEFSTHVRTVLERNDDIKKVAPRLADASSIFFIGRGINYPLALEGALKLKEISYLHAEGFAAGELKHGPFALLTEKTPVIAIVTQDETYEKMITNIGEVKARGPPVIAIASDDDEDIEKHADVVLRYPGGVDWLSCIPITVMLQLLAYHVADIRNCSIDKPRNLAKSVTVE